MNIQTQLCGLVILLLLFYFFKRKKAIGFYSEKIFFLSLNIVFICLVLDIVSILMITNIHLFPLWLVKFECKLYLVSLILNGYIALAYTSAEDYHPHKKKQDVKIFTGCVFAYMLLVLFLPINIYHDGFIAYTYGPACTATYICAAIIMMATAYRATGHQIFMSPKRRSAIKTWLVMWIIASVIQFVHRELLLVGFASALGLFILFFELENPEASIDRGTGLFNADTFARYLYQCYRTEQKLCGLCLTLDTSNVKQLSSARSEAAAYEISEFIKKIPNALHFKTDAKEFALLFHNRTDLEKAFFMLEERFGEPWLMENIHHLPITIKPHYILVPDSQVAHSADEMLAILKYYRARYTHSHEKHIFVIDETDLNEKREREKMLEILSNAIKYDRVEVFFQPIYSSKKKKFVSAEALVRIRSTDGKIIPPGMFIPVAEQTGLISTLGSIVFEKTCAFIKDERIEQYGIEYIEVNLSVVQCESTSLAKTFIAIMDKYKVDPKMINLEITESASIATRKILLENMNTLIDYGVSFSLDDFGNGQSNLNYIVDMPVKIVKFDRDLTQSYFKEDNHKAQYVLQAAMNMIQSMHLSVVSEGVETAHQLETLEKLGVDYIQGFYFSKPIPADEFIEFIKKHNGIEN
ncbi:MAG: EAL domain-containing protein [Oscillospiraceae bacterium]|nr:EAL domain-containing protein [Oscillospiraceae bacterium]